MNSLDIKDDKGPFDIIGDVHGCYDELCELIDKLGYTHGGRCRNMFIPLSTNDFVLKINHPDDRKLVFVGDLTDRGSSSDKVISYLIHLADYQIGYFVIGNHDDKLKRYLQGKNVQMRDGLQKTINQLIRYHGGIGDNYNFSKEIIIKFLNSLPSHLILDEGRLAVTHGALKQEYFGLDTQEIKSYCMYGAPVKKHTFDIDGRPRHQPWAEEYKGDTLIVHGHIVVEDVKWVNNTVNIDTGCVFGGKLTAFRYPEREIVQVQAKRNYHAEG